jgi:hypothetical protein
MEDAEIRGLDAIILLVYVALSTFSTMPKKKGGPIIDTWTLTYQFYSSIGESRRECSNLEMRPDDSRLTGDGWLLAEECLPAVASLDRK